MNLERSTGGPQSRSVLQRVGDARALVQAPRTRGGGRAGAHTAGRDAPPTQRRRASHTEAPGEAVGARAGILSDQLLVIL